MCSRLHDVLNLVIAKRMQLSMKQVLYAGFIHKPSNGLEFHFVFSNAFDLFLFFNADVNVRISEYKSTINFFKMYLETLKCSQS